MIVLLSFPLRPNVFDHLTIRIILSLALLGLTGVRALSKTSWKQEEKCHKCGWLRVVLMICRVAPLSRPALQPVIRSWRQPETPNHLTICRTATGIR